MKEKKVFRKKKETNFSDAAITTRWWCWRGKKRPDWILVCFEDFLFPYAVVAASTEDLGG
jgi:hypothetical protein